MLGFEHPVESSCSPCLEVPDIAAGRPSWVTPTPPVPEADGPPNAFFSPTASKSFSSAVTVRQVPRRLWQPDHEAEACSLMACGKKFGSWYRARKHHCRQCGRVVCGPCSARMVLPARWLLCIVNLTSCGPLRLPCTHPEMLKNLMVWCESYGRRCCCRPRAKRGPQGTFVSVKRVF